MDARHPDLVSRVVDALSSRVSQIVNETNQWSSSGNALLGGVWTADDTPMLVKIGVDDAQFHWACWLSANHPTLIPMLFASGGRSEYGANWLVLERVEHECLSPAWNGAEFTMLLDAAVRFQLAARAHGDEHTRVLDLATVRGWLEAGIAQHPPGPAEAVLARLADDWAWVSNACQWETCHGDVHMCNVVARIDPPQPSDALLIDYQPVRQPWAMEAAYAQVLNSIDTTRIGYRDLVYAMACIRTRKGLSSCADLERLSRTTLAWYAIRMWALSPDRHGIDDYAAETERYIRESVE